MRSGRRYLGMREGDLEGKPYAKYWNPAMAPHSPAVRASLAGGPSVACIPGLAEVPRLAGGLEGVLEDGYALGDDGALHVAIRTAMPGATPAMVDWWFGWHADEPQRYKLWHPRAHVHAEWRSPSPSGATGRERYVGRMSHVNEYLGTELGHLAIRFLRPTELGFDSRDLADPLEATAVCARAGFARGPIDAGYLVHHVRRTPTGAEMASRFWLGGPHAAPRGRSLAGTVAVGIARGLGIKPKLRDGRALLAHCAEEMAHLASFLPRLYAELGEGPGARLIH